jgi:hypothetical protein
MTLNKRFWPAAIVAALLGGGALQAVSVELVGLPAAKPAFPIPGHEYVSATRDGQTDHSLFFFNLFGFGDRIKNSDALVVGSSHSEFGINAAMLSRDRGFNMALGGGEGLSFAATLLRKYPPHPSFIAVDPFAPDPNGPSTEAARVLTFTPADSYRRVFSIWSGFLRDWMLQGLLPRVTIANGGPVFESPIGSVIVRDWRTADVTAVYSSAGEVFSDPSKGHLMLKGPVWNNFAPTAGDLSAMKAKVIVVTALPYPSFSDAIARETADRLGAQFVPIDAEGLQFWDFHHLNRVSRDEVTARLIARIESFRRDRFQSN